MADADDLDTISDADLRARMLAQGLSSIPVTSSSRKVLVKRLRNSLRGQASPAVSAAASTPMDKPDGPASSKSGRSVASKKNDTTAADRRRSEGLVVKKPVVGALTRTRRTSKSQEMREEHPVRKPESIVADAAVPKRTNYHKNTLEVNSVIVLESNDEGSPAQSNVTAEAPALASTSSYRRSPPRQPVVYDLSDDNEADDVHQYASAFTRNLARQRSERIGRRNSPFSRRTAASTGTMDCEPQARRSLPPDEASIYMSLKILFILCVFILLNGVYRFFTRD